ncbi:hypothetical protein [Rhodopila sp.]|uniref:hypothetical protein n=1 Tax=Rhodopila sp. TaxID=2480087 RepID=UPI003D110693
MATKPVHDIFADGGSRIVAALGHLAPGLTDRIMEKMVIIVRNRGRRAQKALHIRLEHDRFKLTPA